MCSRSSSRLALGLRSRAQRPASCMPPNNGPRPRRWLRPWRLLAGVIRARRPAKLSALIKPAATSSCRAFSSSLGSKWASCTSSSKNKAPCSLKTVCTRWARRLSSLLSSAGLRARHKPRRARGSSTSGVLRRVLAAALGARRTQAYLPARQASSSQRGL
ncbi:hypothetical protein D3C81_1077810 [compost metagenome]